MTRARRVLQVGTVVGLAALAALAVPRAGVPAADADDTAAPVVAALGDFACDPANAAFKGGSGTSTKCRQSAVSDALLADPMVGSVLGLGDFQYDCDDLADFAVSYTPTWGRFNARMVPVAGNHEYKTGKDKYGTICPTSNKTATSFFTYFGAAAHGSTNGHFSFDLGSWHLIGLNANCRMSGVGGCSATSSQTGWLAEDLAATTQPCIAAFWHQPLFNGLASSTNDVYRPWWRVLYDAHTDIVLNGHVHTYARFDALDPDGKADPAGITEYVVGTGGESLGGASSLARPRPVFTAKTYGYSRFTLHATGWDMQFVNTAGQVLDSASGTCH